MLTVTPPPAPRNRRLTRCALLLASTFAVSACQLVDSSPKPRPGDSIPNAPTSSLAVPEEAPPE